MRYSHAVTISLVVAGFAVRGASQTTTSALAPEACAALAGFAIPAPSIDLPTGGAAVQSVALVAASAQGNANGDYCKVTGIVKPQNPASPNLEFEVNLPLTWNRRVLQMGGGGYDGSLVSGLGAATMQPARVANPLKQGFVTLGTDGGHKGRQGFDGSFGMDDEALRNYGKESIKKGHDAAMAIVKKAYGRGPDRTYFIGGSQGGHEALDAAARYPDDYDGVGANYPAYNVTLLHLGSLNAGRALYDNGGAGWMNAAKVKLLTDAVYAACDTLDGAGDGLISNVKACNDAFDVKTLRCPNGADTGDTCLSDAQLGAVARIASDYKPGVSVAGMDTFPKWPLLEGATFRGGSNFGQVPQPSNPLSGREALLYSAGEETAKYIITRDPSLDAMKFDPKAWQARIAAVAAIMDVSDVSLARFKAKGGKIILTHGTADDFITPHNTELYYNRQVAEFGKAGVDSFIRFYMIPGFGHGQGIFNAKFDELTVLQDWVERGQPPARLTVADGNANANRSRPLCEWPAWPEFSGATGTENNAASFTCAAATRIQTGGAYGAFTNSDDVGAPTLKGSAQYSTATHEYTVTGSGSDIWGTADQFHYVWRRMSGDFTITATTKFLTDGIAHRKASIMLRKSLDADAPFVHLAIHGDGLPSLQFRSAKADTVNTLDFPIGGPGIWTLKLARQGSAIHVSIAKDGAPLKELGATQNQLGSPVLVGLGVASHTQDAVNTVVFSNVRVE